MTAIDEAIRHIDRLVNGSSAILAALSAAQTDITSLERTLRSIEEAAKEVGWNLDENPGLGIDGFLRHQHKLITKLAAAQRSTSRVLRAGDIPAMLMPGMEIETYLGNRVLSDVTGEGNGGKYLKDTLGTGCWYVANYVGHTLVKDFVLLDAEVPAPPAMSVLKAGEVPPRLIPGMVIITADGCSTITSKRSLGGEGFMDTRGMSWYEDNPSKYPLAEDFVMPQEAPPPVSRFMAKGTVPPKLEGGMVLDTMHGCITIVGPDVNNKELVVDALGITWYLDNRNRLRLAKDFTPPAPPSTLFMARGTVPPKLEIGMAVYVDNAQTVVERVQRALSGSTYVTTDKGTHIFLDNRAGLALAEDFNAPPEGVTPPPPPPASHFMAKGTVPNELEIGMVIAPSVGHRTIVGVDVKDKQYMLDACGHGWYRDNRTKIPLARDFHNEPAPRARSLREEVLETIVAVHHRAHDNAIGTGTAAKELLDELREAERGTKP